MNFAEYVIHENLEFYHNDKPLQSVYLEFVRRNCGEILEYGEFEALRRWILKVPVCMPIQIHPAESHRISREFFRALRKEEKYKKDKNN